MALLRPEVSSAGAKKSTSVGGLWRWLGLGLSRSDSYMEIQAHPFVQLVCQWGDLCIPFAAAQQKKVKDVTPNLSTH